MHLPVRSTSSIVAVLGAGNYGTAIAQVLAENGHRVHLWNWEQEHEPLRQIELHQENKRYMPGIKLLKRIVPMYTIEDAMRGVEAVFLAVPSSAMGHTISFAARHIPKHAIVVNMSKGFNTETLEPLSKIIAHELHGNQKKTLTVISGPAVANQLMAHHLTAMNIASLNKGSLKKVQGLLANPFLRLVPTQDMLGVEIGGLAKNVYAIAFGMCDGLQIELNTKAALVTIAAKEMSLLMKAMGAKPHTAYELAGLGDLIGTGFNTTSRNCRFGRLLGGGKKVEEAEKEIKQTVEGVRASLCLHKLEKKYGISSPLADMVYRSIHTKGEPVKIMEKYLSQLYR